MTIVSPAKQFYRVDEVVKIMGVSRATVYRRISDGTIPSVRLKGVIRIPILGFQQMLASETAETES